MIVVACNSATAAAMPALRRRMMETTLGVDVIGVVRPEARAGRGRDADRADRAARDADDRRQRRVRRGARATSTRTSTSSRSPAPISRRSSRAAFPFDEGLVETVRGYCRRCGGRSGHGDPRLHPLPARRPMLQRMLGRGVSSSRRARALARQVEHVLGARGLGNPARRRGRLPLPLHRARSTRSARSARVSCRCRSARSSTSTLRRGGGG